MSGRSHARALFVNAVYNRRSLMRGAVAVEALRKSFGPVTAVRDLSLEVAPGELVTLLGPSGCGKTTLLRLIAGLEQPDAGRLRISGRDVSDLPAYRRPVNTVFQHYALFPHRTVAGNVAFGLEMAGVAPADARRRVAAALELVRLEALAARRPHELSGGQKQRVALARALVVEPDVLLLDEPLAAVDPKVRKEVRLELKELQRRVGTTFIFVTHDQEEALVMSDRIAVMNEGSLEQVASPVELYERPRTRFAADFLAVRNLLEATVVSVGEGRAALRTAGGMALTAAADGYRAGEAVTVGIRPERIAFDGTGENRFAGTLEACQYLGDRTDWQVRVEGGALTVAEASGGRERQAGQAVTVSFPAEALLRLEAAPR
jgi:ABC-type Fe3+/spermidine/putrescine transport system ATPase subunit